LCGVLVAAPVIINPKKPNSTISRELPSGCHMNCLIKVPPEGATIKVRPNVNYTYKGDSNRNDCYSDLNDEVRCPEITL